MPYEHGLWVVTFECPKEEVSFLVQAAWRSQAIRRACRISHYDENRVIGVVGPDIPRRTAQAAE